MKRTIAIVLAALAAIVLFAGLVHFVLVAAHVSEPAPATVRGMTTRRLWALATDALGLAGLFSGGFALRRSAGRVGKGRRPAVAGLGAGLIAVISGGMNLAVATGGPGSGNGVIGAAGALVLGLIAITLSGVVLIRSRASSDPAMVK